MILTTSQPGVVRLLTIHPMAGDKAARMGRLNRALADALLAMPGVLAVTVTRSTIEAVVVAKTAAAARRMGAEALKKVELPIGVIATPCAWFHPADIEDYTDVSCALVMVAAALRGEEMPHLQTATDAKALNTQFSKEA